MFQKYSERSLAILLNIKPVKYMVKFCETEQRKTQKLGATNSESFYKLERYSNSD